ncbi:MAG: glycosyltransferase family 4 protein [Balneolaceae bacterium]
MKILQIHNRYRQRGGEDVAVEQERALLASRHEVIAWEKENEVELESLWARIRLLVSTHDSQRSRREMAQRLSDRPVDLVHVHNTFPLFTPGVLEVAREKGIPAVMSLHNYRLIHPNGLLFHEGKIDERSVNGSAWRTVPDGVYRDSILQTAVVAHLIEHHRKKKTWQRVPDLFIVLTEFAKQKLAEGGIPEQKMVVKPNFTEDPFNGPLSGHPKPGDRGVKPPVFLYVGRMSREKGVEDVIETWLRHRPQAVLRLIGEGPQKSDLQERSKNNPEIEWAGRLPHEEVLREMARSRALLFSSRCYEGFPMTLVEAFASGCPVIATDIGSQGEIVNEGETGLKVPVSDPDAIAERAGQLIRNPELARRMGETARRIYERNYTPGENLRQLEAIYEEAVRRSRSSI